MGQATATEDHGTVADGYGSEWPRCGPRCDIEIVRPGKVQCNMADVACLDGADLRAEVQRLRDELGVATTVRDAHLARAERAEGKLAAIREVLNDDTHLVRRWGDSTVLVDAQPISDVIGGQG